MNIDNSLFSSREKEVVDLLLLGKSNKQIALALGISVSTVEFHLKNIYGKLGVKSRTEAVLRLGESIGRDPAGKRGESIVDGIGADAENGRNTIPTRRIPMKQLIFVVAGSLLVIVLGTVFVFALAWPSANRANTKNTISSNINGNNAAGNSNDIPNNSTKSNTSDHQHSDFLSGNVLHHPIRFGEWIRKQHCSTVQRIHGMARAYGIYFAWLPVAK